MEKIVKVEFDGKTGDGVIPIPEEILESLGWQEGDTIMITHFDDGKISLSRKED